MRRYGSIRGRIIRAWSWFKREDGYTFSLNFMFVYVTFGMILLSLLLWFGSAMSAYVALRSAAASAAFAAQAQVQQVVQGTSSGYVEKVDWQIEGSYERAANALFTEQVSNTHLDHAFSNLLLQTSVEGSDIQVTVTGSYLPLFLQKLADKFPQLTAASVPMQVVIKDEYEVVGG